jgi:aminoglycoside phosphotransferase (APT) family kinase protein
VRALVDGQFPEARELELGDRYEGWDCVTWRLGNDWAVRLPRTQLAADMQVTEFAWLPRICGNWPFRAPVAARIGQPHGSFPWRWAIVPWIHGHTSFEQPLSDYGAHDLGEALRSLHQPTPPEAPRNPLRSTTLLHRAAKAEKRLDTVVAVGASIGRPVDAVAALQLYRRGAAASRSENTWAHMDLHGGNVLTMEGRLAGIVDWVDAGAGDPATDLGQAMALLPPSRWDSLIHGYGGIDPATFNRARAEALNYALILATVAEPQFAAAGWAALEALGLARRTQ